MEPIALYMRLAAVSGLRGEKWKTLATSLLNVHSFEPGLLESIGLTPLQSRQFFTLPESNIEHARRWQESNNKHLILTMLDSRYPEALADISRPPPVLYIKGDPSLLNEPQLAVIGSRECSFYGRDWGTWFSQALALSGLVITSGLARGIDGIAHRAALDVGGRTLAVLGSGLEQLYPRQHLALADEVVEKGGAIISEFPLLSPPYPTNFPRRNRIISGLSHGVLVVEASLKSGSLVTARYALEQNRNVYALPGALGNRGSEGTNWLIQQGAMLISHPNNILEDLRSSLNWLKITHSDAIYSEDSDNAPLPFADVLANVGDEVTPVDVVAERAGQPVPVISAQLLELELAGWIAAVPGGYVRLRRACHVRRTNVLV